MPRPTSDELTFRLAQRAAALLGNDPTLCDTFATAARALRERNGPKRAYAMIEDASKDATLLCELLLDESEEGDVVRSMAPFYAVVPESERLRIIGSLAKERTHE
jgi:hypothetical protein